MEEDTIQPYAVVALTEPLPEHELRRGQVGTVIEVFGNGEAFEVDFSDRDGQTYASVALRPDQLMVLHHERGKASDRV